MSKRKYTAVQVLLPEIKAMVASGKSQREIAIYFGLADKEVVRELLRRERRKECRVQSGIMPRPKGRPRKNAVTLDIVTEQRYEIERLKMENELLRNFLQVSGRGQSHQ